LGDLEDFVVDLEGLEDFGRFLEDFGRFWKILEGLEDLEGLEAPSLLGAKNSGKVRAAGGSWSLRGIRLPLDGSAGYRDVLPGDGSWQYAKLQFRSSLIAAVHTFDHIVHCHFIAANAPMQSLLRTLSMGHPVSEVFWSFGYRTTRVNREAYELLFSEHGLWHRMMPWTYDGEGGQLGLRDFFRLAAGSYTWQRWPDRMAALRAKFAAHGLASVAEALPIYADGNRVYCAFESAFALYVLGHDADLTAGTPLASCRPWRVGPPPAASASGAWANLSARAMDELAAYWAFDGVPQFRMDGGLTAANLVFQLAQTAFDVTAFHEFVGTVVDYSCDPAAISTRLHRRIPNQTLADLQQFWQQTAVVALTGIRTPLLLDHLSDVVKHGDPRTQQWAAHLEAVLEAAARAIEADNERRPVQFHQFNPWSFEVAVNI